MVGIASFFTSASAHEAVTDACYSLMCKWTPLRDHNNIRDTSSSTYYEKDRFMPPC